MDGTTLRRCGEVLYGEETWRSVMSHDFALNRRRLKRMEKDEEPIPAGLATEITEALYALRSELNEVIERVGVAA